MTWKDVKQQIEYALSVVGTPVGKFLIKGKLEYILQHWPEEDDEKEDPNQRRES